MIAAAVPAATMLGYQSVRGMDQAATLGSGSFRASTVAAHGWLLCLDQRLSEILPAGGTFYIQPSTDPMLSQLRRDETLQRLTELAFPRFQQVPHPAAAQVVLSIGASESAEACDGVLVESGTIP